MHITVTEGDITDEAVDAVVNAANSSLLGGGGVDGAIHRAAGPSLLEECRTLRQQDLPDGLPAGDAVATGAGQMPARWIIHTVGPNRRVGETDPEVLASCFRRSLETAAELSAESVAFPAIGAGVYGWEARDVARAARRVLDEGPWTGIDDVRFVLFDADTRKVFERTLTPR
ncbi:MAG: O-acetyl-ADP-ribose deacetylase [Nesterenkonia sp.]|nr:O-acetyl-ADP-ribose deacetylase [Nesterenkonia sp.]